MSLLLNPYVIGITGASGSGKTTLTRKISSFFTEKEVCVFSQDNYYKPRDQQPLDHLGRPNYDTPESLDIPAFVSDLKQLLSGKEICISEYTFNNPLLQPKALVLKSAPVVVVEGLFLFSSPETAELTDLKIFMEVSDFVRIKRRIHRDRTERGYDLEDVLYRTEYHVEPAYQKYIEPARQSVDLILPGQNESDKAFGVLAGHIRSVLANRDTSI